MTREEVQDLLERMADGDQEATQVLFRILSEQDPATQVLFMEAIQHANDADLWEQMILTLAGEPPERGPRRRPPPAGPLPPEPLAQEVPRAARARRESRR